MTREEALKDFVNFMEERRNNRKNKKAQGVLVEKSVLDQVLEELVGLKEDYVKRNRKEKAKTRKSK